MGLTDAGQDPNATRQADCGAELRPQQICFGLRSDAVSSYASENFEVLCRVVDSKFGHVSAELLFELRAAASNAIAVQAFESLVGPEAASGVLDEGDEVLGRQLAQRVDGVVAADVEGRLERLEVELLEEGGHVNRRASGQQRAYISTCFAVSLRCIHGMLYRRLYGFAVLSCI